MSYSKLLLEDSPDSWFSIHRVRALPLTRSFIVSSASFKRHHFELGIAKDRPGDTVFHKTACKALENKRTTPRRPATATVVCMQMRTPAAEMKLVEPFVSRKTLSAPGRGRFYVFTVMCIRAGKR